MRFVAGGLVLFGDPDEFFMRQQIAADVSAKFRFSMSSNGACRRIGKSSGANSKSAVHVSPSGGARFVRLDGGYGTVRIVRRDRANDELLHFVERPQKESDSSLLRAKLQRHRLSQVIRLMNRRQRLLHISGAAFVRGRSSKRNQPGDSRLAHRSRPRRILRLPQGMIAH